MKVELIFAIGFAFSLWLFFWWVRIELKKINKKKK